MQKRNDFFVHIALIVTPLVVGLIAISIGRYPVPIKDVIRILFGGKTEVRQMQLVILNIRLPRVLLAMLVGSGLSVSGVGFQSLFSNPLATPDTIGVASGASFGAVLALTWGFGLIGVQAMAFIFGVIAVGLTFFVGSRKGQDISPVTIILSGIIIGALFNALISLVKYTANAETELPAITYWLMGSLSTANFRSLSLGAPLMLIGIIIFYLLRWRLNILTLSLDEAKSTGTNMKVLRIVTVLCGTAITASAVSMCGQVGWIGLLVPHACRMLFGSDNKKLVGASISLGATFMIIIDTIARSATAAEIPVSILTAIIGAPFFILLLRKSKGWAI